MLGIPSIGIGVASLWNNVKKGHIGSAIWDGVGIVADGVAVAVPGVPGGVGLATKAARLAALKNKVENTIDTAETVVEVGTAVASGDTNALVEVITDQTLDRFMSGKKKGGEAPGPKSPKQTNAEADAAAKTADAPKVKWKSPEEWAKHDHDALRDRLREENKGYESGRHDEFSGSMSKELRRMADDADGRGHLPEYGKQMRKSADTYEKRARGAAHKGGRRG